MGWSTREHGDVASPRVIALGRSQLPGSSHHGRYAAVPPSPAWGHQARRAEACVGTGPVLPGRTGLPTTSPTVEASSREHVGDPAPSRPLEWLTPRRIAHVPGRPPAHRRVRRGGVAPSPIRHLRHRPGRRTAAPAAAAAARAVRRSQPRGVPLRDSRPVMPQTTVPRCFQGADGRSMVRSPADAVEP